MVLFIQAGMAFSSAVSSVFVNMYLYRFLSGIAELTIFNLFQFALIPFGFYLAALASRKIGKVPVLVSSLWLFIAFYGLLLILGDRCGSYLCLLGAVNGLATGAFWYPFNIAIAQVQPGDGGEGGHFFGIYGALGAAASALAPFVSTAALILAPKVELGYAAIFVSIVVLSVAMGAAALVLKLPVDRGGPVRVLPVMRSHGDPRWAFILQVNLVYGIRDGASWSVMSILVLRAAGSDAGAGRLSVLFALVGIVANFAGGRTFLDRRGSAFWGWGSLIALASSFILVAADSPLGAALAGSLWKIGEALVLLPYNAAYFSLLARYMETEGDIAGRSVAMETTLNAGRMVGAGLFLALSFVTPLYAEILYPAVTLAFPASWLIYRRYRRSWQVPSFAARRPFSPRLRE